MLITIILQQASGAYIIAALTIIALRWDSM
jgi:hypothetical protein